MLKQLSEKLTSQNQQHLLQFWNTLSPSEQTALAEQINAIDFDQIGQLHCNQAAATQTAGENIRALAARAQPPLAFRLNDRANPFTAELARERGSEALRAGQIGVVLVAGGQGTRLGFDAPKGTFPIGPVSGNSLFQILLEKVIATSRRYATAVPVYLMTSPATQRPTLDYLSEHNRFGLPENDLFVFCQGTMPAVDADSGKLLLSSPARLALSPDGHGGMLPALMQSGARDDMRRRGIEHLFYFQIDNPLTAVCDPTFIGYHLLGDSQLSTQVVAKGHPTERVGNVVSINGKIRIIEYSDLPEEVAQLIDEGGEPKLWAGNIAVHVMSARFLDRAAATAESLPFHIANKKVPYLDSAGKRVEPKDPNAIKFERFIFDLLPLAQQAIVMEVDRGREFAPVKNGDDQPHDTPRTVRQQMIALHGDWLRAAGVEVAPGVAVEISPLVALDATQATERLAGKTRIAEPTVFD